MFSSVLFEKAFFISLETRKHIADECRHDNAAVRPVAERLMLIHRQ